MDLLRKFAPYLRPYRGQIGLVLLSMVLTTSMGLLAPWLIRSLVQTVRLADEDVMAALWGVRWIAAGLAVAYLLRSGGQFLTNHLSHVAAWQICHDLRAALYRQLQRLSPAYYANRQSGEIVSRVIKDTDQVEPLLADVVYDFAVSALLALGTAVILFQLDASLTLLAMAPLPLALAALWMLRKRIFPAFEAEMERLGALSALVQDNVSGMKEIQVFNRERDELDRVHGLSHQLAWDQIHARRLVALLSPLVEGATGLSIVIVVLVGGSRAVAGALNVEDLVAFVLYLTVFYQPLASVVGASEDFQRGVASLRRVFQVLAVEPAVADPPDGRDPGRVRGDIRFETVSFGYIGGLPVLHDVSFHVAPGETLALVGPTGAGKSTIISLVARFYDVDAGRVRIDGVDVRAYQLHALRRNVSMVLQDVFLFNGSVRENIRFGKPDATDEEVLDAARSANAHEFIQELPHGYDTQIGERGVKLSGGQKQRLSIARALLKDAPILILDEATSSVDTETEAEIHQALERLRRGRTCLLIAHRLSTVRSADRIAVIDRGRLVDIGPHDQIVAREGLYQRLYARQVAGE
jgi:ABC-type multidrug transport system fused ATPase/permease subunit